MSPIIIIPGMWASAASGAGLKELIEKEYKGKIYIASKEKYQKRSTVLEQTEAVKAEFAHLKDPILIGHSLGAIIALKLAEQGYSHRLYLICPGIPANFSNISLASAAIFLTPILTRKPFLPNIKAFKKYFANDCQDSDIQKFYATFITEYPSLYDDFFLRRHSACLHNFDYLRNSVKGEIFSATGDLICPTPLHKKIAGLIDFTLHIVDGSHSPFFNQNKLVLKERMLGFIEKNAASQ